LNRLITEAGEISYTRGFSEQIKPMLDGSR